MENFGPVSTTRNGFRISLSLAKRIGWKFLMRTITSWNLQESWSRLTPRLLCPLNIALDGDHSKAWKSTHRESCLPFGLRTYFHTHSPLCELCRPCLSTRDRSYRGGSGRVRRGRSPRSPQAWRFVLVHIFPSYLKAPVLDLKFMNKTIHGQNR